MSIFKCKMCGGTVEFETGASVGVCDSCGTQQTLPRLDDERRANLYDRANHFRRSSDFDKAAALYEQILNEDTTDAEAYWSLVLCRYGIEYVEDPATHRRVPTVNRAQFTSVFDDDNYKLATQYADGCQRGIYEEEAKAINDIQKGILAISQREEPFDVFICYKETDANGRRTPDSVLANDLYHQLTQEGFKVFFARITLEDKLGQEYEPYIFAALNSAKVMVVLGTRPEYFKAVWVRNEWSRYLSLVRQSGGRKALIPAYKDMDPYDLPDEFSHLQAQDMSKLGFMQDLIRGIKKIAVKPAAAVKTPAVTPTNVPAAANPSPLLRRAFIFLEDGNWQEADAYCEKVLDAEPECAEAYLGKLMAELHVCRREDLPEQKTPFEGNKNYEKAVRFGDPALKASLESLARSYRERVEAERKDVIYAGAKAKMTYAENRSHYESAIAVFESIRGWKGADEQIELCRKKIREIEAKAEAQRLEAARRAEQQRIAAEKAAKKRKKAFVIGLFAVCVCIALWFVFRDIIIPYYKMESLKNASIGDTVYFGAYEQDNHASNGKEDIRWKVLAKEGDRVLVISEYGLDCEPYNTEYAKTTWETCTLRAWLNDDFFNTAFSGEEKAMIPTVTVTADKNPEYNTDPGNATQDKVFLLSITEANQYFSSDSARQCKPTDYAVANGAYVSNSGNGWWWLRSPGYSQSYAAGVFNDGGVYENGDSVHNSRHAVRPALWIDLDS